MSAACTETEENIKKLLSVNNLIAMSRDLGC